MCRLSIIVPYVRDEAAFETTLVSVLENRPEYCEVIVAHDGQYQDPFDLGDEVRFVVSQNPDSIALLRAAVAEAHGRVVHIMMGGVRATEEWSSEPLSLFEQTDLGCVSPVIRDLSAGGTIVAAGWKDTGGRLQQPIARGSKGPSRREVASVQGAFLAASFWRRMVLESLLELPLTESRGAVDYILASGLRGSGWRCRLAAASNVIGSPRMLGNRNRCVANWKAIQAFRSASGKERGLLCFANALYGALLSPTELTSWLEFAGRTATAFSGNQDFDEVASFLSQISPTIGPNAAADSILKIPAAARPAYVGRRAA